MRIFNIFQKHFNGRPQTIFLLREKSTHTREKLVSKPSLLKKKLFLPVKFIQNPAKIPQYIQTQTYIQIIVYFQNTLYTKSAARICCKSTHPVNLNIYLQLFYTTAYQRRRRHHYHYFFRWQTKLINVVLRL